MEIPAIYENGIVRPLTPLTLPESTLVNIVVPSRPAKEQTPPNDSQEGMDEIYEILSRRHNSGHSDTAARHNELEP